MNAQIRLISFVTATACACLTPPGALAEQAAADDSGSPRQLEEIVVTAQKRAESLQQTPIAISAYTATFMDNLQLADVTELARYVPNLQYSAGSSGSAGSSNLFIRGIGQIDFITTTDPGVGTYIDGVYVSRVTGAALDLADVERVEVLRGPQGTLFGRNTIGGALNVVTARPTGELGGRASVAVGSDSRLDGMLLMDAPLADRLAGRMSLLSRNSDGWGRNLTTGERLGKEADLGGSLQLLWTVTEKLELLLAGDMMRQRGTTMPHGMTDFVGTPAATAFNSISPRPIGAQHVARDAHHVQVDTPMHDDLDAYGVSLTADWEGALATLKLITAYREQDGSSGQDFDGSPAPYLNQVVEIEHSQFSQELQLTGDAAGGSLKWLAGLYYFTESGQFDSDVELTALPITIFTGSGTDSYAAFGQLSYALTDRLSVTGGLRWTREKKEMQAFTDFAGTVLVPPTHLQDTFRNLSPKLGVDWQLSRDAMLYASVTRGFRSGGFNGRPFSPADLTAFEEETTTSYEVGLKSDWFDRRLRINTAVFYNDYEDIQLTATALNEQGDFIVVTGNAAQATLQGVEVEVTAVPAEGLSLFASVGYLEDSLKENPGFSFGATELPSASEWSAAAGGDVSFRLGGGRLKLGADYSYRSAYMPQYSNAPASRIDSYGLLNARVGFEASSGTWLLTLYGKNLTDEDYRTYGQTAGSGDTTLHWFGRPRELGARVTVNF